MIDMEQWSAKWNELTQKAQPGISSAGQFCHKTAKVLNLTGVWIWRLRKVIMAIPIIWLSIYIARLNYNMLPDMVGINLQLTGEYARMVSKSLAVYGPLAITGACMLMMMVSRKTLFPWLICLFSLALPMLILFTNVFPG